MISCEKESSYGEAGLRFYGMEEQMDIFIYPIELFSADILSVEPLTKLKVNIEKEVLVEKFYLVIIFSGTQEAKRAFLK